MSHICANLLSVGLSKKVDFGGAYKVDFKVDFFDLKVDKKSVQEAKKSI